MQAKGLVTWEVATLAGYRKRFKFYNDALEVFESTALWCKVWLEEYHGNKLVRSISKQVTS